MIDSLDIVLVGVMIDKRYLEEILGIDDYTRFIDNEGKTGYSFTYKTVNFKYYSYRNLVVKTTTHKILDKKDITLSDREEYKSRLRKIIDEVIHQERYDKSLLVQIDYCADINVGEYLDEYVKVMNKHSSRYKQKRRRRVYKTSIQISSVSGKLIKGYGKVACIKDKAEEERDAIILNYKNLDIRGQKLRELEERTRKDIALYKDVIRLEISIRKNNLKYYYKESIKKLLKAKKLGKSKEEIDSIKIESRTIDNYWNKESMCKQFFKEIKQYYYTGDYYKLSIAVTKIKESDKYTNFMKDKLILFICRIKCVGIDRVKRIGLYSKGTIRNYIKMLSDLGINPITIDEDSKYDMLGSLYTLAIKQAQENYFDKK